MPAPALATALDLAPHPEGGWYRRTWTSPVTVETEHGPRPTATAILYLLDGESRWHRVRSTELWMWHSGSGVELRVGERPGHGPAFTLNRHSPQQHVPAGWWQSATLSGEEPALVTCVVSPGFDFADFELAVDPG
ncbi:cupin domain-containing protein [Pseudonocardia xishanensis]|uniref:Cupin domain-containing protein n=1 Tax=Pseudonocardia xishanensis TaxID=630995 RepID=A0ABP8RSY3_9PSEU